jgi:hypothetical protein
VPEDFASTRYIPLPQEFTDLATGLPDPFSVATVNGEQTKSSTVVKKTLNPYWNEAFDM